MDTDKISRSALMEMAETVTLFNGDVRRFVSYETIDNAPPAPDWTPCFEKQPDKDGVYHVTANFNGRSITRDQTFAAGRWLPAGTLMVHGKAGEPEVIAWMAKPKPYESPEMDLLRPM